MLKLLPRGRPGFSLVEMLCVMAIIAILASLMLPAVAKGLRKARGLGEHMGGSRGIEMRIANQGARALVVACNFELQRPEAVLELCDRFKNDGLEQSVYGGPLALFQLNRVTEAEKAFRRAKEIYPRIAAELLKDKHVRPDRWDENRITLGGADQTYAYWKESGKFWRKTPGALAFAAKIFNES